MWGAAALMCESDGRRVNEALELYQNGTRGPLNRWLDDLRAGRCRLPALSPFAMKDLLLAWLHPQVGQPMCATSAAWSFPGSGGRVRLSRPERSSQLT
jgi:hypothetical protein